MYVSGLPYSFENSRLLYRSILWSAHGEGELHQWFSSNYNVEVHAYPDNGKFCVVNNTYEPQETTVYKGNGESFQLQLGKMRLSGTRFNCDATEPFWRAKGRAAVPGDGAQPL